MLTVSTPTRRELTHVRRLKSRLAYIEFQTAAAWNLRHITGDKPLLALSAKADEIENELDLLSNAAGAY